MKKWVKILLWVIGGIVLIGTILIGFGYYNYYGKYPVNKQKYPYYIGYLNPSNPDMIDSFQLCNPEKKPIGYYSSSKNVFRKNKKSFKDNILTNFDSKNYKESGFLNIRFLINCYGDIGNIEVNELNIDLELSKLEPDLVHQILELSLIKENWKPFEGEEHRDSYMYLIFKIEDGKISEILP